MHAKVGLWAIFAIGLFVVESMVLDRRLRAMGNQSDRKRHSPDWLRVHWFCYALSLVTVFGAVAGSHGWSIF